MTTFEFVSVLLSIVVSLAFAHLLTAIARLIQSDGVKFSWFWAGWVGILLFCCVDYWFSLWLARDTSVWSFGYVVFWLVLATVLYLSVWLAVPNFEGGTYRDLPAFFAANRRRMLGAVFLYLLMGNLGNMTVEAFKSAAPLVVLWLSPIAAAWVWADRRVQAAALAMLYVLMTYYA